MRIFIDPEGRSPKKPEKIRRIPAPDSNLGLAHPEDGVPSDVLGSYTGIDEDGGPPAQDADDL